MDCTYFRELLVHLPYNELNEEETSLVQDHLKGCDGCRTELKDHERIREFSKILSASTPVDDQQGAAIQRILEQINTPPFRKSEQSQIRKIRIPGNLYRIFRIVTNMAAVLLTGLFLYQQIEIKKDLENLQTIIRLQDKQSREQKLPFDIAGFASLSENQLKQMILEYDELLIENNSILTYLRLNHPEIYREIQHKHGSRKNSLQNL